MPPASRNTSRCANVLPPMRQTSAPSRVLACRRRKPAAIKVSKSWSPIAKVGEDGAGALSALRGRRCRSPLSHTGIPLPHAAPTSLCTYEARKGQPLGRSQHASMAIKGGFHCGRPTFVRSTEGAMAYDFDLSDAQFLRPGLQISARRLSARASLDAFAESETR